MEIKKISISQINPDPRNPRIDLKPGDPEYEKLKQSMHNFGCVQPLVWNKRTGNLVGGHQRLKILKRKGYKEIEVSLVDLDHAREKQLNIALNKVQGKWDKRKLAVLLEEFCKIPDFNAEAVGFTPPELSQLFDQHLEIEGEDDFDANKAAEAIVTPITKPGEIIELGPHRILCGDSSSEEDMKLLFDGVQGALCNTDVPYNVRYTGNNRPCVKSRFKEKPRWEKICSDDMPQDEYEKWMRKVLVNMKKYLKPGAAIYIWQGHRQIPPMYQILIELDFHISSIICWLKDSAAISYGDYSFKNEHALYGWLRGETHYFAGKPGESNVWEISRDLTKNYKHPTQKPVELARRAIINSSIKGDVVLDTFLGSGSTLIAAESIGRRCYGVELSSSYCDVIVRRYIAYVGKDKVSDQVKNKYLKEVASEHT